MFVGLDLGTSSIKAVLVGEDGALAASASAPLTVERPRPGWSEQDPRAWEAAALAAMDDLARKAPKGLAATRAVGLSGQMHGAVFVDGEGAPLRPCILWNDGRAEAECAALEAAFPPLRAVTGNRAMAGFTAPKALWLARHEPEIFAATRMILLPKAWLRRRWSGESVEDMSDASGTLWLDVAARDWSDAALAASGLDRAKMPRLAEGSAPAGRLSAELARRWGMATAPLFAGGAGDNAAGAIGLGAVRDGDAFVSLGTSGVLFAATERFAPNPASGVHAFCHALPGLWHQMGVILSAAACLAWWADVAGEREGALLARLPARPQRPSPALFLPYLSGERTPHADAAIRGAFLGLGHETDRAALTQAVLEGVAFAVADCRDALREAGSDPDEFDLIGGGSRSDFWAAILAAALDRPVHRVEEGEAGAALGAARLARLAATGEAPADVCARPRRIAGFAPDPALVAAYAERRARWRAFYPALKGLPT